MILWKSSGKLSNIKFVAWTLLKLKTQFYEVYMYVSSILSCPLRDNHISARFGNMVGERFACQWTHESLQEVGEGGVWAWGRGGGGLRPILNYWRRGQRSERRKP